MVKSGEKKREAMEAVMGARMFYYCLHLIVIGILLLYDNDLKLMVANWELTGPLLYFGLFGTASYLLHVCAQKPGYVSFEVAESEELRGMEEARNSSKEVDNQFETAKSSLA